MTVHSLLAMDSAANTKSELLVLEPSKELILRGPFNETPSMQELRLFNPNSRAVCYKVKTTAPKCYCVRPNSGIIQSKCNVTVSILLQPGVETITDKTRHRFMVQCAILPDGGDLNMEKFWREINPRDICDIKLKCVFDQKNVNVNNLNANAAANGTHDNSTSGVAAGNLSSVAAHGDSSDSVRRRLASRNTSDREYHEAIQQRSDASPHRTTAQWTGNAESDAERIWSFLKVANGALCQQPFMPLLLYTAVCVFVGVLIGKLF